MANKDQQLLIQQSASRSPTADETATQQPPPPSRQRSQPKRFVKNQIPESILNDPALNAAIAILPSNYNFEIHKCVWRVRSSGAKRVSLQFPEGLLMYSLVIADILTAFAEVDRCFVLGDVTYGACCVDDLSASALLADLLIHYGHSCLVPIDFTSIPCLYIFVDIQIDVNRLIKTVRHSFYYKAIENLREDIKRGLDHVETIVLAGTIQFASAIRAAKPELEKAGFRVLVPQAKPLSAGEVLGCTAPSIPASCFDNSDYNGVVLVFVADGRFHLEAFMIANPRIRAFRYDPYMGKLFLEEYDHKGMKDSRRNAIMKAREAKNWGIILGTLGRQGNPRILGRLEKKMTEKGLNWTVVLMSEISPSRIALFGESVDAWIQIACPRLSIDWGDAFEKPVLTPFEADIALGDVTGWWERKVVMHSNSGHSDGLDCAKTGSCCSFSSNHGNAYGDGEITTDYPMDYYAQDGGDWNSCHPKRSSRPTQRNIQSCSASFANS